MAADDHLSPVQFMSMKRLGRLPSGDYPGFTMHEVATEEYPNEHHPWQKRERQDQLTEDIGRNGIQKPLKVERDVAGRPVVGDGHHRYIAAHNLGKTQAPVEFSSPETHQAVMHHLARYTPPRGR